MTVIDWLLDSDPAVRWQVMRDLTGATPGEVERERARVADEGWGARLLDLQAPDGQWAGGTYFPRLDAEPEHQPWTATAFSLQLMREFGVDPAHPTVRHAVELVRAGSKWEHAGQDFFAGEVEPCINGLALAVGSYFGEDMRELASRLVGDQLEDGGWNCATEQGSVRGSFHSTIAVLEGLMEFERTSAAPDVTEARVRGEDYLLDRHLMRRLSTGEIPDEHWLEFSFPTRWYYDVLRALDYLRAAGANPDERVGEAIVLLESKRTDDGRWLLENTHQGAVHFDLEDGDGEPSRWNTLRALRVLDWYRG